MKPKYAQPICAPAEALDGGADSVLHRLEVGHVGLKPHCAIAQRGRVLLQALGLEADERDVGTLGIQPLGARLADAAGGASDEHGAPADVVGGGSRATHLGLQLLVAWRAARSSTPACGSNQPMPRPIGTQARLGLGCG